MNDAIKAGILLFGLAVTFGVSFGFGAHNYEETILDGRCMEACAPRPFESRPRPAQCLCRGSSDLVPLKEIPK